MPLPLVLGQEGAGTVLEVGAGTDGFAPGDRVAWAGSTGSYAERAVVRAAVAYKVPATASIPNTPPPSACRASPPTTDHRLPPDRPGDRAWSTPARAAPAG
ncbi:hypothetical protein GBAR_LOCUS23591 [Geodia barretti]|uniref:Alcohol dehydrogenase-like N-terminal domain-containing protein n=1 Tax=Geodia barretti TaxID=519541 RepID=A0AA35T752_GEOBA|nr:hypothetical protein GBAR_LOCUS23591 [Geodia barretti]